MLKLRLQRNGRKKRPTYRLVVIEHSTRRDGKPVEYVGYYKGFFLKRNDIPPIINILVYVNDGSVTYVLSSLGHTTNCLFTLIDNCVPSKTPNTEGGVR